MKIDLEIKEIANITELLYNQLKEKDNQFEEIKKQEYEGELVKTMFVSNSVFKFWKNSVLENLNVEREEITNLIEKLENKLLED